MSRQSHHAQKNASSSAVVVVPLESVGLACRNILWQSLATGKHVERHSPVAGTSRARRAPNSVLIRDQHETCRPHRMHSDDHQAGGLVS